MDKVSQKKLGKIFSHVGGWGNFLCMMATVGWAFSLWTAAVVFLYRRSDGCFTTPLSPLSLTAFALFLTGGTWLAGGLRRTFSHAEIPLFWLPLGILGVAVQIPGTSICGVAGFWLCVLTAWGVRRGMPRPSVSEISEEETPEENFEEILEEGEEPLLPDDVTQQLTRTVSEEQGEAVEGFLRADFAPGQRKTTLYVAFCPPFSTVPCVTCEPADGDATVEPGMEILPHGVKISVRKTSAAALEDRVLFHFLAVEKKNEKL